MKYVVVDLEMNPIQKKYKREKEIWKMETIQIGAVVLDENFQEISTFSTLVKPQYNEKIEKRYEQMTGITTEMVENAPIFKNAMEQFLSWCKHLDDELEFLQWSDCDLMQIQKEIELKHLSFSNYEEFLDDWVDFQEEFGDTLGLGKQISLNDALSYAHILFKGDRHNALHDARNTGYLLEIIRDEKKCQEVLGSVIQALNPTHKGTTLGELFDFSKFYS
ncbi:MAG: exonuclease domain-containing protein [Firmicutes bacterium]|nr:exonuclease domain-containing protein [Bacillota bacterium]